MKRLPTCIFSYQIRNCFGYLVFLQIYIFYSLFHCHIVIYVSISKLLHIDYFDTLSDPQIFLQMRWKKKKWLQKSALRHLKVTVTKCLTLSTSLNKILPTCIFSYQIRNCLKNINVLKIRMCI